MAENRRGLGRGLSALLGEVEEIAHAGEPAEGVRLIPIELIRRNAEQPRQVFPEAEIAELAASIRDKGVLQPILVRPVRDPAGTFEIVAGERRWRAAQAAGLAALPALVRDLGDLEAFEIAVIENIQREDLNATEEARAYAALMARAEITQEQVAQRVGKSRSHVANMLRLLQLPPTVLEHLVHGRLTAGHARALLSAENPERIAELVVEKGLSVREAEAMARGKGPRPRKTSGPRRAKDADTAALEVDLEEALGMGVDVIDRGGAGEIRVRYANLEQLDEVCRRLTRR